MLTITKAGKGATTPMYTHEGEDILYVNKDRTKVVPEDSPEAAFVLVGPGGQIPDEDAEALGLNKKKAEAKAVDPAENKAQKAPEAKK